jgi:hypothetical protein
MAGDHTLNSMNNNFYVAGNRKMRWDSLADAEVSYTRRSYAHQHIVDASGQFKSDTRSDNVFSADLGWRFPRKLAGGKTLTPGMTLAYTVNDSDQNNYDAQSIKFIKDYYGYGKFKGRFPKIVERI